MKTKILFDRLFVKAWNKNEPKKKLFDSFWRFILSDNRCNAATSKINFAKAENI